MKSKKFKSSGTQLKTVKQYQQSLLQCLQSLIPKSQKQKNVKTYFTMTRSGIVLLRSNGGWGEGRILELFLVCGAIWDVVTGKERKMNEW